MNQGSFPSLWSPLRQIYSPEAFGNLMISVMFFDVFLKCILFLVFVGWWNLWSLWFVAEVSVFALLVKLFQLWHAHIPSYVCWWNRLKSWWNIPSCVDQILLSRSVGWPWGMVQRYVKNLSWNQWVYNFGMLVGCVFNLGYFMGYTCHWMHGYGVFLDLQEQPLYIVFRQSVTKPSITSTQTVIAIMEEKFIIKLL